MTGRNNPICISGNNNLEADVLSRHFNNDNSNDIFSTYGIITLEFENSEIFNNNQFIQLNAGKFYFH